MVMGSGGFNIGSAYGEIRISTAGISTAINDAKRMMNEGARGMADSFKALGDNVAQIGSSLTMLTAPLAAVGASGLKTAADFDTLMKQIEVFGGVSGEQLEAVRGFALKMGADTKFSADEAAAAYLDLLKSGQSLEQATASLPNVLNLAAAGELGLAEAAGVVSAGLAIFNLKAEDSARVSNALAKAANASRADVRGLGQGLSQVGGIAAMFGLDIEQTSAVLGVFANRGIEGAEAGTQLKSMLMAMNRDTKDAKDAWAELGTSLYDTNGNMRDFDTVIDELDRALDGLPVEEQNRLMQALGGSFGIVGLNALRAEGGIDAMLLKMGEAPDAVSVADAFMNTFKGTVESLKGSFETLMITALTPFMNDFLKPLVTQIISVVNSMSAWATANPELTSQIVKVLAALVVLGPTLMIVGRAMTSVIGIIQGVGGVLGILMGPLGLVIAAVALFALAWSENFMGIRDVLQPILDSVVSAFTVFFDVLGQGLPLGDSLRLLLFHLFPPEVATQILSGFSAIGDIIFGTVVPALQTLFNWFVAEALPAIITFVTTVAVPAIERFIGFLQAFWEGIQPGLNSFFTWVTQDALPLVVDFFNNILAPAVESFVTGLGNIWAVVGPVLVQLFNWFMAEGLPFITDAVRWFMENIATPLITLLGGIWEAVGPILGTLLDWFVTTGLPFINDALTAFRDNVWNPIVTALGGIWDSVSSGLTKLLEYFTLVGIPFINGAISYLKVTYLDPLIATLKSIWDTVSPHLTTLVNFFKDQFAMVGQNFVQPVLDFINKIPAAVQNAIAELVKLVDAVVNNPLMQQLNPWMKQVADVWNQTKGSIVGTAAAAAGSQGGGASFGGALSVAQPYIQGGGASFSGGAAMAAPGAKNGGTQIGSVNIVMPEAAALNPALARDAGTAAADGFEKRIEELRQSRGG